LRTARLDSALFFPLKPFPYSSGSFKYLSIWQCFDWTVLASEKSLLFGVLISSKHQLFHFYFKYSSKTIYLFIFNIFSIQKTALVYARQRNLKCVYFNDQLKTRVIAIEIYEIFECTVIISQINQLWALIFRTRFELW